MKNKPPFEGWFVGLWFDGIGLKGIRMKGVTTFVAS